MKAAGPKDLSPLPAKRIVDWKRLLDLPSPAEHEDLGLEYTYEKDGTTRLECRDLGLDFKDVRDDELAEKISACEAGDKLAGWPLWIQGVEFPNCPKCNTTTIPLFQVDSQDHVHFMGCDAGCAHVTQCSTPMEVVAFGWACG